MKWNNQSWYVEKDTFYYKLIWLNENSKAFCLNVEKAKPFICWSLTSWKYKLKEISQLKQLAGASAVRLCKRGSQFPKFWKAELFPKSFSSGLDQNQSRSQSLQNAQGALAIVSLPFTIKTWYYRNPEVLVFSTEYVLWAIVPVSKPFCIFCYAIFSVASFVHAQVPMYCSDNDFAHRLFWNRWEDKNRLNCFHSFQTLYDCLEYCGPEPSCKSFHEGISSLFPKVLLHVEWDTLPIWWDSCFTNSSFH